MFQYKKPRYKIYLRLFEDIRNDFRLEKFNNLKWKKLKNNFKFQIKKWSVFNCEGRTHFLKKLKFVYNHLGLFSGPKKRVYELKRKFFHRRNIDDSIFFSWLTQRLKKEYKKNLLNKQRLLLYYNIPNHKLKKLVTKGLKTKCHNILKKHDFIIENLERRLDNILYKSGFVKSMYHSRQLINHEKVLVNKIKQSKVDYLVNVGDIIDFVDLPSFYLKKNLICNIKIKKRKKRNKLKTNISLLKKKNLKRKNLLKRIQKNKNKTLFLRNTILLCKQKNFNFFQQNRRQLIFLSKNQLKKPFFSKRYQLKLRKVLKSKKKHFKLLLIRFALFKSFIPFWLFDKLFKKLKLTNYKKRKYYSRYILKRYPNFLRKKLIMKKFIKKRKKLKFLFLYFFSNFLEINYKTLSILILNDIDIRKSFKYFLNLFSISNYYFHH